MGSDRFTPDAGGDRFTVVGLGELIWDLLPGGRRLGGAPTNFAYVARLLGGRSPSRGPCEPRSRPAAAVARTPPRAGVSTQYCRPMRRTRRGRSASRSTRAARPTQRQRELGWDHLEWSDGWRSWPPGRRVCFARSAAPAPSRAVIARFLAHTPRRAARLRRNLRPPSSTPRCSPPRSDSPRRQARRGKLTRVAELAGVGTGGGERAQAERLARAFDLRLVAVTRGARGSCSSRPRRRSSTRLPCARGRHIGPATPSPPRSSTAPAPRDTRRGERGPPPAPARGWRRNRRDPRVNTADVPRLLEEVGRVADSLATRFRARCLSCNQSSLTLRRRSAPMPALQPC